MQEKNYLHRPHTDQIPVEGSIIHLPIEQLYAESAPKRAPRRNESIRLQQNIRKYGISSPLTVCPVEVFPGSFRYRITEGEPLWRAASLVGLTHIPCRVLSADHTEQKIEQALAQIRSQKLHFLDQATVFQHLAATFRLTQAEIAKRCGLSQSAVANKLRLLQLEEGEMALIRRHGLSERHARALLCLSEPQKRATALFRVLDGKLTVSQTEGLVRAILEGIEGQCAPPLPLQRDVLPPSNSFLPQNTPFETQSAPSVMQNDPNNRPSGGTVCVCEEEIPSHTCPENALLPTVSALEIRPKRFILHTLQPLYNSLERTLSIFRKTGRQAQLETAESAEEVVITIRIPTPKTAK